MRLRTYTLHVSNGAVRGDGHALDEAAIVADGFTWSAFAFSVLWFLRHRLWLAAALVLVLFAALALAGQLLGLSPFFGGLAALLASALVGLEASSLRRWTCGRRGRPARDAVVAADQDEAEAKLVARWLAPAPPRTATPAVQPRPEDAVIGLFPLSEGGR